VKLTATLNVAQQVPTPHGVKAATGTFSATLKSPYVAAIPGAPNPWTLRYRLTWKSLSGPLVAAEIRYGAPGKAGPLTNTILCQSAGDCRSGTEYGGEMPAAVAKKLLRGTPMYVEVHTKRNPAGEI
jgi:hypothetical protein